MNRSPAGSGPGRGTPRSRTTARPGERSHRERRAPDVEAEDTGDVISEAPPLPRARAGGVTWRLVVLCVVILGLTLVLAQSLRIYFVQASQLADVRAEIAAAQADIADQRDQLERWQDPEYVRSQARVRLGWVMPGEVGYRVIGADGKPIDGSETVGEVEEEITGEWYERMLTSVQIADEPAPEPEEEAPAPKPDDEIIGLESPSPSPTNQ